MAISEIDREQDHVSTLYERVDALRTQASARLAGALGEAGDTAQARIDGGDTAGGDAAAGRGN